MISLNMHDEKRKHYFPGDLLSGVLTIPSKYIDSEIRIVLIGAAEVKWTDTPTVPIVTSHLSFYEVTEFLELVHIPNDQGILSSNSST